MISPFVVLPASNGVALLSAGPNDPGGQHDIGIVSTTIGKLCASDVVVFDAVLVELPSVFFRGEGIIRKREMMILDVQKNLFSRNDRSTFFGKHEKKTPKCCSLTVNF
jgi:hypothetical protein